MKTSDMVRLIEQVAHVCKGSKGKLVEEVAPNQFEVEFIDEAGRTFSLLPIPSTKLKLEVFS